MASARSSSSIAVEGIEVRIDSGAADIFHKTDRPLVNTRCFADIADYPSQHRPGPSPLERTPPQR